MGCLRRQAPGQPSLDRFDWVVGTEQWAIRVYFHKYRLLRRTIPLAAQRKGPASTEWARAMGGSGTPGSVVHTTS